MFVNGLGEAITLDTSDMMVPVLIPRAASPAVTGWNSAWLVAGAAALAWVLFGSRVRPPKKKDTKFKKKAVTKRKR